MRKKNNTKTRFLNALGAAGYVGVFVQWMWLAIVFLPWIASITETEQAPCPPAIQQQQMATLQPSLAISIIAISIGLFVVGIFLYVLIIKLPKDIAKVGKTITHEATRVIAPIAVNHLPPKVAKEREIPGIVMIAMKYTMTFLPCLLMFFAQGNALTLVTFEVAMIVGVVLFAWSFFIFITQYIVSRMMKINYKDLL